MEKLPAKQEEKTPSIPGIGVGGMVMCPYGFQKAQCLKQGCEMWIELSYGKTKVARCAIAWQPVMLVELRQEIEKLRGDINAITTKGNPSTG